MLTHEEAPMWRVPGDQWERARNTPYVRAVRLGSQTVSRKQKSLYLMSCMRMKVEVERPRTSKDNDDMENQ